MNKRMDKIHVYGQSMSNYVLVIIAEYSLENSSHEVVTFTTQFQANGHWWGLTYTADASFICTLSVST